MTSPASNQRSLVVLEQRPTRIVDCGTCRECCKHDAIFMHPECGDDPAMYATEDYEGRLILQHKPNGDCIYLDDATGCTIHATRPVVCREFSCVALLDQVGEKHMLAIGLQRAAYAARRVKKNGKGSAES